MEERRGGGGEGKGQGGGQGRLPKWARGRRGLGLVAVGGGLILTLFSVRGRLKEAVPEESGIVDKGKKNYIFPMDPEEGTFVFLRKHLSRWWPVSIFVKPIVWQMFDEIRKSMGLINEDRLQIFASYTSLLEAECEHFSHYMDTPTAIALARNGADPKLFISPRLISKVNKDYYGDKFRELFENLPKENIHPSLSSLISTALKIYHPTEKEQEEATLDYYSGFESDFHLSQSPVKAVGEIEFLKICLQGVISHSRILDNIKLLMNHGVLDILVVIGREYSSNVDIMSLVLKVLANISCNPSSAELIRDTGCLKMLAESAQSPIVKLALPAKRALHNLDRRGNTPILPPGVYQLYPDFGCVDCKYDFDIVFIHGLLGGVFRTWRRHDVNPDKMDTPREKSEQETRVGIWKSRLFNLRNKSTPLVPNPPPLINPDDYVKYPIRKIIDNELEEVFEDVPLEVEDKKSPPTQCWPRDWLPDDLPQSRIIAVDFESYVSRWMNICPIETSQRRLKDRSAELLQKLQDAGVGKRPIVWITHSMGGLLLKSLLCQSAASDEPDKRKLCENTKGIVFCSVPHQGTDMAVLNTARRWLLLPTEEIEELSNQQNQLTDLNDCFLDVHKKYAIQVLSYGEILETRTGLGMKFKLVPFYSADVGVGEFYPLRLDHLGTCKPWSRGSFLYLKLVDFIKNRCGLGGDTVVSPTTASVEQFPVSDKAVDSFGSHPFGNLILWLRKPWDFLFPPDKEDENENSNSDLISTPNKKTNSDSSDTSTSANTENLDSSPKAQ